jgi:hypothetical protein
LQNAPTLLLRRAVRQPPDATPRIEGGTSLARDLDSRRQAKQQRVRLRGYRRR